MEAAAHPVGTNKHVRYGIRWLIALTLAVAAASSHIFYVAQGIVVTDLIGLTGREEDVLLAQHHAAYWLAAFAVFQVGLIIAIFSTLQFGADATPLARFIGRGTAAVILSIPATFIAEMVVFYVFQLQIHFRSHLR
jgi:hypothetical protein